MSTVALGAASVPVLADTFQTTVDCHRNRGAVAIASDGGLFRGRQREYGVDEADSLRSTVDADACHNGARIG